MSLLSYSYCITGISKPVDTEFYVKPVCTVTSFWERALAGQASYADSGRALLCKWNTPYPTAKGEENG